MPEHWEKISLGLLAEVAFSTGLVWIASFMQPSTSRRRWRLPRHPDDGHLTTWRFRSPLTVQLQLDRRSFLRELDKTWQLPQAGDLVMARDEENSGRCALSETSRGRLSFVWVNSTVLLSSTGTSTAVRIPPFYVHMVLTFAQHAEPLCTSASLGVHESVELERRTSVIGWMPVLRTAASTEQLEHCGVLRSICWANDETCGNAVGNAHRP